MRVVERHFDCEFPAATLLPQPEVQAWLQGIVCRSGTIGNALAALECWLSNIGYFAHLTQPNLFLTFPGGWAGVELWLQVNYSRLNYRAPMAGTGSQRCPLCYENIGQAGKELLRVYEFELAGTPYFAHPTPFPLHAGHFVLNVREHTPMRVNGQSLREALAFLKQAPGWLLASNSDVEWAGASVLGHHHFQIFRELQLPVEAAPSIAARSEGDLTIEWLDWPAPVARLKGRPEAVIAYAEQLIAHWKAIEPGRCTGNYLMRLLADQLVLSFFFRNPSFITPSELKRIKSEGVGIVEMAGEAIVPPQSHLDIAGNREFFERIGREFTIALISANAPPAYHKMWAIPILLGFREECLPKS